MERGYHQNPSSIIDSCDALVLLDSGSTYSFVSHEFARKAKMSMQQVLWSSMVSSPGGIIASFTVCPGGVVSLDGEDFCCQPNGYSDRTF